MTPIQSRGADPLSSRPGSTEQPEACLIGLSGSMRVLEDEIDRAARSDAQVLVMGETGVGKEAVAQLIHRRSPRASAAMVALTCAGLPDVLLESDLFGHVQGGFTGAFRDKPGLLEMAQNGTVFVNDIGDMSARVQLALLRFMDSGDIQRVGADGPHARIDVRVVAATSGDLQARVRSGAFRDDLHDRLSGVRLVIPPLRDRTEDIPLLVESFLRMHGRRHGAAKRLSPDAMAALVTYRWPGNVRELKSRVERAVLTTRGAVIGPRDLQFPSRPEVETGLRPTAAPASSHASLTS